MPATSEPLANLVRQYDRRQIEQLHRRLGVVLPPLLPLRTTAPQGSVERGHARLAGGRQRRQLVRAALGRGGCTPADRNRR